MITINKATTANTVSYYYDTTKKRFGILDTAGAFCNHGFNADIEIIVDAGLYAHEYDIIINNVIEGL